jgi:hypothetical protein
MVDVMVNGCLDEASIAVYKQGSSARTCFFEWKMDYAIQIWLPKE